MGQDEESLLRLWREKRGEVEPEDLSGNLIVQFGRVTEELNRLWFERNTGQEITDVQLWAVRCRSGHQQEQARSGLLRLRFRRDRRNLIFLIHLG